MRRSAVLTGCVMSASMAWWIWAQQAATSDPLARLFPAGSLLYVEARNFAGLLSDWNASAEKKLWLASDNYQVFSRSRLFLKLSDAHKEFADAAGFLADLPMVQSVAGSQSAVAIYDIGALEFLYATRLDNSAAVNTVLFKQRNSYETRTVGGRNYFVRRGGNGRTAAFASVNGLLLLATREDLVANALKLVAGQNEPALAREPWFTSATEASQAQGDVRMALNMRRLLDSTYFRSYWVQRNASELRPYVAGVVDLFRESGQLREQRTLIREIAVQARSANAVAQILAWAPDDVGLRRAWADPTSEEVLDLVRTKIVSPGPTTSREQRQAPLAASPDSVLGTTADLETRIDPQPLQSGPRTDDLQAVRTAVERVGVAAVLHVQRSRTAADGVYIGNESGVAVLGNGDWPDLRAGEALVQRRGRALVFASTPEMLKEVTARLGAQPVRTGASYSARYQHSREFEPFARMMSFIDTSRPVYDNAPQFFSGNVASLGRTFERLRSVDVVVQNTGAQLNQQIVYSLQ